MDNMPDFDNMTPDEINKWLETLAKRQGATEGLTTDADMEIAEIDPDSVVIDEPGYIPFGQEGKQPKPEPAKAAEPVKATPPPPPAPTPSAPPQPVKVVSTPVAKPAPEPMRPAARQSPPPPPPAPEPAHAEQGGLAWLESLAGGQEDNSLFNLDLGNLPTSFDEPEFTPTAPAEQVSSLSWLEDLARTQDQPAEEAATLSEPFGGSDSVEWLESLARRQGADTEELITPAQLEIPVPDEGEIEEPGYVAFSFDSPPVTNRAPAPTLSDPSQFLSSLAEDTPVQPAVEQDESEIDSIQRAISSGTVTREQMQVYLEHQADVLASEPEILLSDLEESEELAPADLPDWLLEQVGAPPGEQTPTSAPTASLESLFPQQPAVENMPDWLQEEDQPEEGQLDFSTLFGTQEPEEQPVARVEAPVEIDPEDTWAEAFDLEHERGAIDVQTVPDWYERNVKDPVRIAAVEQLERREEDLVDEPLPGDELPVGEAQGLPAWLVAEVQQEEELLPAAEPAFADWLKDLENPEAVEVPEWLMESQSGDALVDMFQPLIEPEPPQPVKAVQPPPPAPEPVKPTPPPPARPVMPPIGGSAALERARDREQNGDLEGSLIDYEALIRANIDLDTVVADLAQLVKSYRTVPAVYRVLGDGLMRQGKLQQALNTYREALNQL